MHLKHHIIISSKEMENTIKFLNRSICLLVLEASLTNVIGWVRVEDHDEDRNMVNDDDNEC